MKMMSGMMRKRKSISPDDEFYFMGSVEEYQRMIDILNEA
jgi:hypothetical protein